MRFGRWAVALVVFSACGGVASGATVNQPDRGVIALVGDSNVMLGAEQIAAAFGYRKHWDPSYTPVLIDHAGAGMRTSNCSVPFQPCGDTTGTYWANLLPPVLSRVDPDMIVTNLGINDTLSVGTSTTAGYGSYGRKIDWFMRLLPARRRVLWTNLPCAIEPAANRHGCAYVNTALSAARGRWPNLTVLDWGALANKHPEYIGASVHLSDAGYTAWATLVTSALDARSPNP